MLRLPFVVPSVCRFLASGSLLALLAACAGGAPGSGSPTIPVAEETANYRAHARSYYAPPGPPSDPWGPYITEASNRFDVPDTWIRAVIGRESGGQQFHGGTLTTSPVGAMGLMQLMAPTYDELRAQYSLGDDPYEPHDNIMAGTAFVRQLYDIYGSPGFLAAYNAGPGRLDDFLTRNRALPRETRQYVAIIGPQIAGIYPNNRSQADLMVAEHSGEDTAQYAQANQAARSVRAAWTHRDNGDQPVQVAEAPATAGVPAPAYTRSWASVPAPAANAVSAAWAARGASAPPVRVAAAAPATPATPATVASAWESHTAPVAVATRAAVPAAIPAPVQLASAAPTAVSAAWAARGAVAAAPPDNRSWSPAPIAQQVGTVPADPAQPVQVAEAAPVEAAPVAAPAPRRQRFQLIRSAMAEPAPLGRDAGHVERDWAVQVGAFASAGQANQAAGAAQSRTPGLQRARAVIEPVRSGSHGARLFRARLTGLSRADAMQACERLGRGRGECMVVSPDARS